MVVGVLTVELAIYEATSLKDKRRVVRALKDRIRARFNVSVAEVGHQDMRQRASVAIAAVGSDAPYVHGQLDRVVDLARKGPAVLLEYHKDVY